MAAILIDTNLLVYAYDRGEWTKQERAIATLTELQLTGSGRLSAQSLAEFFSATTRGAQPKLTAGEAREQMEALSLAFPVFDITALVVHEAVRGVVQHRLSYWDAQLWASARLNQVAVIFSEDFSDGTVVDGVRFVNPFAAHFDVALWTGLTA